MKNSATVQSLQSVKTSKNAKNQKTSKLQKSWKTQKTSKNSEIQKFPRIQIRKLWILQKFKSSEVMKKLQRSWWIKSFEIIPRKIWLNNQIFVKFQTILNFARACTNCADFARREFREFHRIANWKMMQSEKLHCCRVVQTPIDATKTLLSENMLACTNCNGHFRCNLKKTCLQWCTAEVSKVDLSIRRLLMQQRSWF